MKNLEQIRAMNALASAKRIHTHDSKGKGDKGGDAITGFPALIVNNGLLATLAFSKSKSNEARESGHEVICDEIARHLAHPDIALLGADMHNTDDLLEHLTASDSQELRRCTTEALAFLNYLRRFAKAYD
jgi:CRISPR-associated protein Cmr5